MLIPSPFGNSKVFLPNDLGFTHRHRNLSSAADQGVRTMRALDRAADIE